MTSLTITRGYPGSGKTTWALAEAAATEGTVKAPSRDDLRVGMFNKPQCDNDEEKAITRVQLAAVRRLLDDGHRVIVDDMNLRYQTAQGWANEAQRRGIPFDCVDFLVPPDECRRRNLARGAAGGRQLPENRIDRVFKRYPFGTWKVVEPSLKLDIEPVSPLGDGTGPLAFIWDIDGTVAHMTGRSPYDYSRVAEDAADLHVRALYWTIRDANPDFRMLFVSGRSDDCRDVTERWLSAQGFDFDALHMRKTGDSRDDSVVKLEIFNEHIRGRYGVLGVFDDRDRVVSMWRRLGLKTYQVQPGDF